MPRRVEVEAGAVGGPGIFGRLRPQPVKISAKRDPRRAWV